MLNTCVTFQQQQNKIKKQNKQNKKQAKKIIDSFSKVVLSYIFTKHSPQRST